MGPLIKTSLVAKIIKKTREQTCVYLIFQCQSPRWYSKFPFLSVGMSEKNGSWIKDAEKILLKQFQL